MILNKKVIESAPDGLYSDSTCPGLYLRVRRDGKSRSWIFKRQVANLRKEVALGSAFKLPVAKARTMADRLRALPDSEFLESLNKKHVNEQPKKLTFAEVADRFAAWQIEAKVWEELCKDHRIYIGRLKNYINPHIGNLQFDEVSPDDVAKILTGAWDHPHTVKRLKAMLRRIFAWGIAKGFSRHDNPAATDGPLQFLLPSVKPITKNRGALDPLDVPDFMAALHKNLEISVGAKCAFFAILTATRSRTAREAKWSQIDFEKRIWDIPPSQLKVKTNGGLIVPLSDELIRFLQELPRQEGQDLIFPGRRGNVITDTMFSSVVSRVPGEWIDKEQSRLLESEVRATVHGIARASFRTWAQDDRLGNDKRYESRVAEICLHHKADDAYKGAYERNQSWIRRRELMADWSKYCFSRMKLMPKDSKNS